MKHWKNYYNFITGHRKLLHYKRKVSLRGLSAGNILGYSTTPRTVQQLKAQPSEQHATFITQQLRWANEVIVSYEKLSCQALCWGMSPLSRALLNHIATDVMFQRYFPWLPVISYYMYLLLLCCAVIEVYASWVWSFVLRYPFFKALLSHITTDAMFRRSYHSNFIIIVFCFVFLLCCTVIEVYAHWVWHFVLRYPFLKALLNHITTDAMFHSI